MKTLSRILVIAIMIASEACKKETVENPINPSPTPSAPADNYSSIEDFFSQNGVPVQSFTINGTTGGTFTGLKGTKITIPPYAFINIGGGTVTGDINIKIREIYSKKDMLLSGMSTNTITVPLISGGELYIQPSRNGQAVIMNETVDFSAEFPTSDTDSSMNAYVGINDTLTNSNAVVWNVCSSCSLLTVNNQSYIYSSTYYSTFNNAVQGLGGMWINCDYPFPTGTSFTLFTAHQDQNPTEYQTQFYIWYSGIKGLMQLWNPSNNNNFINYYTPMGNPVTLIAFGIKNGKLFSTFIPTTITQNQTVNFTLSETTTDVFKAQLDALN